MNPFTFTAGLLAVIGLPAGPYYQVHLLLLLAFAVIAVLVILRFSLLIAQWLWAAIAPRSVFRNFVPGIRASVFQGVAVSEFVDEYAFRAPGDRRDLQREVAEFFAHRGAAARDCSDGLSFNRGSRLRSYFLAHLVPCAEKGFRQRIEVEFKGGSGRMTEVRVRYTVCTFYMLRVLPAGLQSEIQSLHGFLNRRAAA
jgi:hypothetical protein